MDGKWGLKTKSLPPLRGGPLPFTRPRAARVFKPHSPSQHNRDKEVNICKY